MGGSLVGNLVALVFNPDSDLDSVTHSENLIGKIPVLGPVLKMIFIVLTLPYATVIDHRSQYSHLPVLSDIIRYLYLEVGIYLFSFIFLYNQPTIFSIIQSIFESGSPDVLNSWLTWVISPFFLGYFLTSIIQTSVHTLLLDGGKLIKQQKGRNKTQYLLGKNWYQQCKKWFG